MSDDKKDDIARASSAIRRLFAGDEHPVASAQALEHLYVLCHMGEDGFDRDPLVMAHLAGRRMVYLEIMKLSRLTADDIDRMVEGRAQPDAQLAGERKRHYDPLQDGRSA